MTEGGGQGNVEAAGDNLMGSQGILVIPDHSAAAKSHKVTPESAPCESSPKSMANTPSEVHDTTDIVGSDSTTFYLKISVLGGTAGTLRVG